MGYLFFPTLLLQILFPIWLLAMEMIPVTKKWHIFFIFIIPLGFIWFLFIISIPDIIKDIKNIPSKYRKLK